MKKLSKVEKALFKQCKAEFDKEMRMRAEWHTRQWKIRTEKMQTTAAEDKDALQAVMHQSDIAVALFRVIENAGLTKEWLEWKGEE